MLGHILTSLVFKIGENKWDMVAARNTRLPQRLLSLSPPALTLRRNGYRTHAESCIPYSEYMTPLEYSFPVFV